MAEVKLENLIEKIRKEGVEGAQQASDEMVQKAKTEAEEIVAQAKKEAEDIVSKGEAKAAQFQANAELAIQQAARDGELMFKSRLNELFDNVFKNQVNASLSPDVLKDMIVAIVGNWAKNPNIEITVAENDAKKLEKVLFAGLNKEVADGIEIKTGNDVSGGFRIGLKDENVYYDFSDESIASILKASLNPRIKEILGKSNG